MHYTARLRGFEGGSSFAANAGPLLRLLAICFISAGALSLVLWIPGLARAQLLEAA